MRNTGLDREILLNASDLLHIGDTVLLAAKNVPGIFQYDKILKKTEPLSLKVTDPEMPQRYYNIGGISKYQDQIVFAPSYASEILIYNMQFPDKVERINPTLQLQKSKQHYRYYYRTAVCGSLIYFIGDWLCEIICLDISTMELTVVDTWKRAIASQIGAQDFIGVRTYRDICVINDVLWVPLNYDNCIMEMDMRTQETKIYKLDTVKMKFSTICSDGINFWLTGEKKIIVKWNKETGAINVIDNFPDDFAQNINNKNSYWNGVFSCSFYEKDYVYFFPLTANMAIRISTMTEKVEKFFQEKESRGCYMASKWDENTFYVEWGDNLVHAASNMLIDLHANIKDKDIFAVKCSAVDCSYCENKDGIYTEDSILILDRFLKEKIYRRAQSSQRMSKRFGNSIYREVVRSDTDKR